MIATERSDLLLIPGFFINLLLLADYLTFLCIISSAKIYVNIHAMGNAMGDAVRIFSDF